MKGTGLTASALIVCGLVATSTVVVAQEERTAILRGEVSLDRPIPKDHYVQVRIYEVKRDSFKQYVKHEWEDKTILLPGLGDKLGFSFKVVANKEYELRFELFGPGRDEVPIGYYLFDTAGTPSDTWEATSMVNESNVAQIRMRLVWEGSTIRHSNFVQLAAARTGKPKLYLYFLPPSP